VSPYAEKPASTPVAGQVRSLIRGDEGQARADPDVTKARPMRTAGHQGAGGPRPQATQARAVPDPQATAGAAVPDPSHARRGRTPTPSHPGAGVPDPSGYPRRGRSRTPGPRRGASGGPRKASASSESVLDTSLRGARPSKNIAGQVGASVPRVERRTAARAAPWCTVASFGTAIAARWR